MDSPIGWPVVAVGGAVLGLGIVKLAGDFVGTLGQRRRRRPWDQ